MVYNTRLRLLPSAQVLPGSPSPAPADEPTHLPDAPGRRLRVSQKEKQARFFVNRMWQVLEQPGKVKKRGCLACMKDRV